MSVLRDGLESLGFSAGSFAGIAVRPLPDLEERLEAYIRILQSYNAKFDLVNTDGHDEIAVRHVLDSLSALPELCRRISSVQTDDFLVADIGSGAGFPGVPLALALPSVPFVLVERMTKRCAFLSAVKAEVSLLNAAVEENQAERLSHKRFDAAVFRAFRPLEKKMMRVLLRILKDGGFLAAYKARRAKIDEEMGSLPGCPPYEVVPLSVPFLTDGAGGEERERNLVVIPKAEGGCRTPPRPC